MSKIRKHAETELAILYPNPDEYQEIIIKDVLHIIDEFDKQEHSIFSSAITLAFLQKLFGFEPLSNLTGEDSEWAPSYGEEGVFYNVRCQRIFKENGVAYDLEGRVFCTPSGELYSDERSKVEITFPYCPVSESISSVVDCSLNIKSLTVNNECGNSQNE